MLSTLHHNVDVTNQHRLATHSATWTGICNDTDRAGSSASLSFQHVPGSFYDSLGTSARLQRSLKKDLQQRGADSAMKRCQFPSVGAWMTRNMNIINPGLIRSTDNAHLQKSISNKSWECVTSSLDSCQLSSFAVYTEKPQQPHQMGSEQDKKMH